MIIAFAVRAIFFPRLLPDVLSDTIAPHTELREHIEGWWRYLKWFFPIVISQPIIKLFRDAIKGPFQFDLRKYVESPAYREKRPFVEAFQEDFKRLVEIYVGPKGKAFVFIDDLDRCEVPKAAELLQALNMMIPDGSRLIFILGIDRKKVAAGIAARYEKLLPFVAAPDAASSAKLPFDPTRALEYGYDFIEKFVQLPFRLPRASQEELKPLLDRLLSKPSAEAKGAAGGGTPPRPARDPVEMDGPEVRYAMEMVAPALDFNPRRMKHFLNLFRLRHYIAEATGKLRPGKDGRGITLFRLAKLVAIELRWPSFLEDVLGSPELLGRVLTGAVGSEGTGESDAYQLAKRWRSKLQLVELLKHKADEDDLQFRLSVEDITTLTGIGGGRPDAPSSRSPPDTAP